ncbi:HD domain-containing protein [Sphingobacterium kitahiroshimense]|uniref:HD domain-containing protein n=1 Tax=Sphingobacterium sp. B16(2022) TaxID=2914044 RepID=UPI00143BE3FB|nr:HD domain-containing protein [Sphingobacterium sp. B16(2022)]NJI72283.1 HD domain-containing protein [Sphingobacterium sp. B16(2022)]
MKIGKILDPIHGLIEITEIEEFIINQRIFGRLRKVKQNTLLNYVFPGANHTRFEHSIGVMHLSEIIFNKSNENVEAVRIKNEKYGKDKEYKTIQEICDDDELLKVTIQELRLAALLHDVGHGPTSHKFDDFTITGEKLLEILSSDSENFSEFIEDFRNYLKSNQDKKIQHELVSSVFIIKLINTLKKEPNFSTNSISIIKSLNIKNILKMIDPKFLPEHEIIINEKNCTDYFNSIIASFPFDADRMDYLYRDSFYSGVKYGFFDQSRILTSLLPIEHKNKITLGIKKSGLDSIVRFIQSRNHLYNQVYFHKTNSATNTMLDFVFRNLSDKSALEDVNEYSDYEDFYCKNGDEYFFNSTLKDCLNSNECAPCEDVCVENEVLDELLDRNLWKRIYEERINDKAARNNDDFEKRKFDNGKLSTLKNELEGMNIFIHENYSSNLGLKGANKSKSVLIDKKNNQIIDDWSAVSDEIQFLNQTNVFIKRIYLRRGSKNVTELKMHEDLVISKMQDAGLISK